MLCLAPTRLDLIPKQLEAVRAFSGLPRAGRLGSDCYRRGGGSESDLRSRSHAWRYSSNGMTAIAFNQ